MQFLLPNQYLTHLKFLLLLIIVSLATPAWSADLAGHVILAKGQVTAVNENGDSRKLKRRSKIFNGDIIKTGANGSVQLRFIDKALMTIKANCKLVWRHWFRQRQYYTFTTYKACLSFSNASRWFASSLRSSASCFCASNNCCCCPAYLYYKAPYFRLGVSMSN